MVCVKIGREKLSVSLLNLLSIHNNLEGTSTQNNAKQTAVPVQREPQNLAPTWQQEDTNSDKAHI